MKILVGVDFSKSSDVAIETAGIWARKFIAEVILVHAYLPPVVDPSIPVGMLEASQMNMVKEYDDVLIKKARSVQETGVKCTYRVILGDLKSALKEVKDELGADIVILGRTTNPDFLDRLVGSTSQHLINDLEIPLLVIPDSWSPKIVNTIAFATSLEFNENKQLEAVKEIANRFKASIEFVKVDLESELDINPDEEFIKEIKRICGISQEHISRIKAEDLKSGIGQFVKDKKADLLVLTSHKRGLLDSLLAPSQSKKLLSKFEIPTLIYHF